MCAIFYEWFICGCRRWVNFVQCPTERRRISMLASQCKIHEINDGIGHECSTCMVKRVMYEKKKAKARAQGKDKKGLQGADVQGEGEKAEKGQDIEGYGGQEQGQNIYGEKCHGMNDYGVKESGERRNYVDVLDPPKSPPTDWECMTCTTKRAMAEHRAYRVAFQEQERRKKAALERYKQGRMVRFEYDHNAA